MTAGAIPQSALSPSQRAKRWTALSEQAERAAQTLPPLLVQAERIAQTVAFGVHGRRVTGPGDSFWQFRRYEPEDSATAIDWRQSAKSQHVYIREREWEAAQSVWFWRDGSPSMAFASPGGLPTKADRATVLLLAVATLLSRAGERVGALREGGETGSGRVALRKLAAAMADHGASKGDTPPVMGLPRFSSVVIAGDFFIEPAAFEGIVSRFAASGARGHVMQVVDPAEEDFPFEGRVRFESVEGFEARVIGRAQGLRDVYRTRFEAHRTELARIAQRFGWSFQAHRTDRPAASAVLGLYRRMSEDHRRGPGRRGS